MHRVVAHKQRLCGVLLPGQALSNEKVDELNANTKLEMDPTLRKAFEELERLQKEQEEAEEKEEAEAVAKAEAEGGSEKDETTSKEHEEL